MTDTKEQQTDAEIEQALAEIKHYEELEGLYLQIHAAFDNEYERNAALIGNLKERLQIAAKYEALVHNVPAIRAEMEALKSSNEWTIAIGLLIVGAIVIMILK